LTKKPVQSRRGILFARATSSNLVLRNADESRKSEGDMRKRHWMVAGVCWPHSCAQWFAALLALPLGEPGASGKQRENSKKAEALTLEERDLS